MSSLVDGTGPTAQLELFEEGGDGSTVEPAPISRDVERLAAALPELLRLGTSSWSFPGWAGSVYARRQDRSTLARRGLAAYAQHPLMRTVGMDRTYYAPIPAEEYAAYAAAVPESFRFLVKAHEVCTVGRYPSHRRYGAKAGTKNGLFLDPAHATDRVVGPLLEGLGERTGVVLFQLPPQRLDGVGGPRGFPDRLHAFLAALPRGPRYAVELRDPRLLTDAYAEALADVGASHCYNVHPTMPSVEKQWLLAGGDRTTPGLVARWMLTTSHSFEQARRDFAPFDRIVQHDDEARDAIARLAHRAISHGQPTLVVVNNKAEGSAPLSVIRLAEAVAGRLAKEKTSSP